MITMGKLEYLLTAALAAATIAPAQAQDETEQRQADHMSVELYREGGRENLAQEYQTGPTTDKPTMGQGVDHAELALTQGQNYTLSLANPNAQDGLDITIKYLDNNDTILSEQEYISFNDEGNPVQEHNIEIPIDDRIKKYVIAAKVMDIQEDEDFYNATDHDIIEGKIEHGQFYTNLALETDAGLQRVDVERIGRNKAKIEVEPGTTVIASTDNYFDTVQGANRQHFHEVGDEAVKITTQDGSMQAQQHMPGRFDIALNEATAEPGKVLWQWYDDELGLDEYDAIAIKIDKPGIYTVHLKEQLPSDTGSTEDTDIIEIHAGDVQREEPAVTDFTPYTPVDDFDPDEFEQELDRELDQIAPQQQEQVEGYNLEVLINNEQVELTPIEGPRGPDEVQQTTAQLYDTLTIRVTKEGESIKKIKKEFPSGDSDEYELETQESTVQTELLEQGVYFFDISYNGETDSLLVTVQEEDEDDRVAQAREDANRRIRAEHLRRIESQAGQQSDDQDINIPPAYPAEDDEQDEPTPADVDEPEPQEKWNLKASSIAVGVGYHNFQFRHANTSEPNIEQHAPYFTLQARPMLTNPSDEARFSLELATTQTFGFGNQATFAGEYSLGGAAQVTPHTDELMHESYFAIEGRAHRKFVGVQLGQTAEQRRAIPRDRVQVGQAQFGLTAIPAFDLDNEEGMSLGPALTGEIQIMDLSEYLIATQTQSPTQVEGEWNLGLFVSNPRTKIRIGAGTQHTVNERTLERQTNLTLDAHVNFPNLAADFGDCFVDGNLNLGGDPANPVPEAGFSAGCQDARFGFEFGYDLEYKGHRQTRHARDHRAWIRANVNFGKPQHRR